MQNLKNFLYIISIGIIITFSFSCTKEVQDNLQWKEAIVKYDGAPALDGCGWVIVVQDTFYEPKNRIDSVFIIDSLEVLVKYRLTGTNGLNCWGRLSQINIKDIKKR